MYNLVIEESSQDNDKISKDSVNVEPVQDTF